jgi:hypothetical protein
MDRWSQRTREAGRKPSSVPGCPGDDHSSRTSVARGLQRPTRELRAGHPQTLLYLVLLQVGFSKPAMSPLPLVSSYLTFSPLPWTYHGGLVSVALSLGLPPLGVTQHPALWSSDFPPAARCRRRSSGLLRGPLGSEFFTNNLILPRPGPLVNGRIGQAVRQVIQLPGHVGDRVNLKVFEGLLGRVI